MRSVHGTPGPAGARARGLPLLGLLLALAVALPLWTRPASAAETAATASPKHASTTSAASRMPTSSSRSSTSTTAGVSATARAASAPVTGRARHIGNDYPWETFGQFEHQDQGTDPWREYYGQCDSFAAWKVYENLHGPGAAPRPASYPAPGWAPSDSSLSPVDQDTWGNAGDWPATAPAHGARVDTTPVPGSVAVWADGTLGPVGHVAYVDDVYPDGSITVENYNLHVNGEYSRFHLPAGGGTETSFGATYHIPWPSAFVHLGDGPATAADGSVLPPEPAPTATQYGYAYSPDVSLTGPGSPDAQFAVSGGWQTRAGHGELGTMRYIATSGSTTQGRATATWSPVGLTPGVCYRIDAFVPDNYSDNAAAHYTVTTGGTSAQARVDENAFTNDWARLGVYRAGPSGAVTVQLDNRGAGGLYVAADALRVWQQPDC
ncbi:CHAP domain-containing protein [Streptomyces sp. NPDC052109]|uniref:CHAP domain-containing protein n=1 Tax=Streptomyces sp. NPDC052109 TaxID=3155527 RepID=UPI003440EAE9